MDDHSLLFLTLQQSRIAWSSCVFEKCPLSFPQLEVFAQKSDDNYSQKNPSSSSNSTSESSSAFPLVPDAVSRYIANDDTIVDFLGKATIVIGPHSFPETKFYKVFYSAKAHKSDDGPRVLNSTQVTDNVIPQEPNPSSDMPDARLPLSPSIVVNGDAKPSERVISNEQGSSDEISNDHQADETMVSKVEGQTSSVSEETPTDPRDTHSTSNNHQTSPTSAQNKKTPEKSNPSTSKASIAPRPDQYMFHPFMPIPPQLAGDQQSLMPFPAPYPPFSGMIPPATGANQQNSGERKTSDWKNNNFTPFPNSQYPKTSETENANANGFNYRPPAAANFTPPFFPFDTRVPPMFQPPAQFPFGAPPPMYPYPLYGSPRHPSMYYPPPFFPFTPPPMRPPNFDDYNQMGELYPQNKQYSNAMSDHEDNVKSGKSGSRNAQNRVDIVFEFRETPGLRWIFPKEAIAEATNASEPFDSRFRDSRERTGGKLRQQQGTILNFTNAPKVLWDELRANLQDPTQASKKILTKMSKLPPIQKTQIDYNNKSQLQLEALLGPNAQRKRKKEDSVTGKSKEGEPSTSKSGSKRRSAAGSEDTTKAVKRKRKVKEKAPEQEKVADADAEVEVEAPTELTTGPPATTEPGVKNAIETPQSNTQPLIVDDVPSTSPVVEIDDPQGGTNESTLPLNNNPESEKAFMETASNLTVEIQEPPPTSPQQTSITQVITNTEESVNTSVKESVPKDEGEQSTVVEENKTAEEPMQTVRKPGDQVRSSAPLKKRKYI
ncbi:hypothetical protein HK098_005610 [Nowakowskiella sp. JEL0407]|nr:hypothetical protein HK098_005610 [Nowakowskiella sp. JEL0407]